MLGKFKRLTSYKPSQVVRIRVTVNSEAMIHLQHRLEAGRFETSGLHRSRRQEINSSKPDYLHYFENKILQNPFAQLLMYLHS
mmetsp:Transcript_32685/g.68260  ORF Transcript_32685/g.68260 Transcript_32685/m.68260 type:complete len:83 (+) Transcript_32685:193-441(+)